MQHIGFIGLGIMGKPMALNLLRAGYPISIYARRAETAEPLIKKGAKSYPSPKELAAAGVDVIITILPTTTDVDEVLNGKNGIIHSAKPGCIVIDMSTISAGATKRFADLLAKKKIEMLDAPVSGGEQGAVDSTLSIMVGGKETVLDKVRPMLKKLGQRIVHIGDHGAGQIAKACNQIIIAETIIAISEALALAKASGVDPAKVRDALMGGFANSRVLEIHGQRMLDNDYKPGFKAVLHRKDIHLALEQAHQAGVVLQSAIQAMHDLDRLVLKGHGDLDSSALHLLVED
jgi:2-hydroxy-3-oxopropionate reductase